MSIYGNCNTQRERTKRPKHCFLNFNLIKMSSINRKENGVKENTCKFILELLTRDVVLDVNITFFERYGRQMNVKTTLCAH